MAHIVYNIDVDLMTIPLQGAALGCMVGQMTYGKRQFESLDGVMRELIPPFYHALGDLLDLVDADSNAFSSYMVTKLFFPSAV